MSGTDSSRLVRSLDDLRRQWLDQIPVKVAEDVVRNLLTRESDDHIVVDVARFGSSI